MKRFLVAALLLAFAGSASAHRRGESYSDWVLEAAGGQAGATVRAQASQLELTRLQLDPAQADYLERAGAVLRSDLQLWSDAGRCRPGPAAAKLGADGWVSAQWTVRCPGATGLAIRSRLFQAVAPSHLHFTRARLADGAVLERVLTHAEPAFVIGEPPDVAASLARYVQLGVGHILSGWDHVAFVLALVLLATRLAEVALLATGFTLAHSLTLAAAVLGWADVREDAVEAVIGFSIALVAAENLWLRAGRDRATGWLAAAVLAALAALGATQLSPVLLAGLALFTACYFALLRRAQRPLRLRIAVAFVFGLVHGFGFADALTPLQLPPDRIAAGLLGFNVGVELGQLLVIAVAWPLLQALGRRPAARQWTGDVASAAICALGTFWFVTRAFA